MEFGLGFNKAKVLITAEKYVAQGKISAAIEEYRKALGREPKDLTLMTTIADLYARDGKTDDAIKLFFTMAEQCLDAGQVPRAIATYKRITKMVPDSVPAVLKLGDLYAMQGLLRDARAYYLQAVNYHMRRNDKAQARDIFEKVFMLDMENPKLQLQMADLYYQTGKKEEAVANYLSAIERFLDRNQSEEASAALQALLLIDPENSEARTLLGRSQLDRGEFDSAIQTLQDMPALGTQRPALNLLFHAYSRRGDAAKANEVANQIFDQHDDFAALAKVSDDFIAQQEFVQALQIYECAFDKLIAQRDISPLVQGLRSILASQPLHTDAMLLLLKVHQQTGNLGDARETMELLARTYRQLDELEKARDIYTELVMIESDNPDHLHLLRQVEAQMGGTAAPEDGAPEPAAAMVAGLSSDIAQELTPRPTLSAQEDSRVKAALTEADLFITYHQISRAIECLETALLETPSSIELHEHLLPLYEQSRDFMKAVACCETLAEAYVKAGDGERASRYGELILTYQQKAQDSANDAETSLDASAAQPDAAVIGGTSSFPGFSEAAADASQGAEVQEVDLSMDWASAATTDAATASSADSDASTVEEIEFYIQAGLVSDATDALQRLESRSPSHSAIADFRSRLGLGSSAMPFEQPPIVEPIAADEPPVTSEYDPNSGVLNLPEADSEMFPALQSTGSEPNTLDFLQAMSGSDSTPEYPISGNGDQQPDPSAATLEPEPAAAMSAAPELHDVPLHDALHAPAPAVSPFELALDEPEPFVPAVPSRAANPFDSLAGDLEQSFALPDQTIREAPPQPKSDVTPQSVVAADQHLQDLFAEFKADMEEPAAAQDIETHYNMGVAFKEMALYDEAIGEFQKVHQLAVQTKDYSHVVQCCSLLATCFLEKQLPELAVKWYQTAINSPGVDPESVLALLYEMGSAQEVAGDRQAALGSFLEVYSRNIDYRDVANRIHSLQQPQ
jgi:pilus assembly protein FimV